ncbi:MAG: hypothetical protein ACE5F5_07610 [Acidimicrobiia bacterium]
MSAKTETRSQDFPVIVSDHGLGENLPQKMGRRLWAPMWVMAIMAFPVAFIIGIVRANAVAAEASEGTVLSLLHTQAGIMFLGFTAVFTAISFSIAKILGVFRKGGGEVQEAVGTQVVTLKMSASVRVFILGMAMAMMTILIASIIHFVWAAQVASGAVSVATAEEAFVILEGVRRLAVAVFLVAITFGLASIIRVLRFQAIRLRELA